MLDPFQMGLLTLTGAQNPELMANMMASQGISPSSLGQATSVPGTTMSMPGDPLGALLQGGAVPQSMVPGAAPAAGGANPASVLAALSGVKTPEAPKPIMQAGVSGAQKAPEVSVGGMRGNNSIDAIMAALLQRTTPAPNLAALLKGVG